jgi:hypothetical protein
LTHCLRFFLAQVQFATSIGCLPLGETVIDAQGFVFLSGNRVDTPEVEEIANCLRADVIEPWLDAWHFVPGWKWSPALEKACAADSIPARVHGRHWSQGLGAQR